MCLREFLDELRRAGTTVSETQIRWAIKTGKVARPRVDGSMRFDFSFENIAEIAAHFAQASESRRAIIDRFPDTLMLGDDERLTRQEGTQCANLR